MPEGPEVRSTVDNLNFNITNSLILSYNILNSSKGKLIGLELLDDFLPGKITSIFCKGKQIYIEINKLLTDELLYLRIHLKMSGSIRYDKTKDSIIRFPIYDTKNNNFFDTNITDNFNSLYLTTVRGFTSLHVYNLNEVQTDMNKIGPDLLNSDITSELWINVIKNPRRKKTLVSKFLLNPKCFSGVGNYLRSEILYYARLSPYRTLFSLSDNEIEILRVVTLKVILTAYQMGGHSFSDYLDPEGNKGNFKCIIYDEKVDPYGNKIVKVEIGNRKVWYVPELQL